MAEHTDEEIALEVKRGDRDAFGVLVRRYEQKLSRYAKRFLFDFDDSMDLVQDVFVKAYVNIQGFDTRRKFSSWIYRIAHNEFVNAIKRKGKEHISFFDADTLFPHQSSEDEVKRDELAVDPKILETALRALHPKYREPLVLYFFEELEYKEIAEIMKVPVSTVGVRLKRGKDVLKKVIMQIHHE